MAPETIAKFAGVFMVPIHEQRNGSGIGHNLDSFMARFQEICLEYIQSGRAKCFAFIFYDFENKEFRKILKDDGAFAKLDRLAGTNLSIFYLHLGSKESISRFNSTFLSKLELTDKASAPCIVFFRINKQGLTDVSVAQLENINLIHGLHELYQAIESYVENKLETKKLRYLRWITSSSQFITLEALSYIISQALSKIF